MFALFFWLGCLWFMVGIVIPPAAALGAFCWLVAVLSLYYESNPS